MGRTRTSQESAVQGGASSRDRQDPRVLEISIFESERCWAAAQELLVAVSTSDRTTGTSQLKHRAQRRLARAVRHATTLVQSIQTVTFDCAITEAQCRAYLSILKAELHGLRRESGPAKEALDAAARVLRNFRARFPLEAAYSQRLDVLEVLRKSLSLDKSQVHPDEVAELQTAIEKDLTIVQSFLQRPLKFKGGFAATDRLEKLAELIGTFQNFGASDVVNRVTDAKRLFVARSLQAAGRLADAYALLRRVSLHADVDSVLFPDFHVALQRCRLSVGAELLKSVELVKSADEEDMADGLEEEKGEEVISEPKAEVGVKGLVSKVASWFGGSRR